MTQIYYPFDAGAGANITESQWSAMASLWRGTGVIASIANMLEPYGDSTGMQVKVKSGKAMMAGHYYYNSAVYTIAIAAADGANPRIDNLVVRLDWTANTIVIAVLTGVAAVSPTAPAVTRSSSIWELSLATVAVGAGVVTIAAGNVTDARTYAYAEADIPDVCQGRLTTITGIPVVSENADATVIYYTPYVGNKITIYNGWTWATYEFAEMSLDVSGYTPSTVFDIFVYFLAGVMTLEPLAWASATARATALARQNGVLVRSGSPTKRYLGTIYVDSGRKTQEISAKRFVWNYYNRVVHKMSIAEGTSHAYNGAARKWNNSDVNNLMEYVSGYQEDSIQYMVTARINAGADGSYAMVQIYTDGAEASALVYNYNIQIVSVSTQYLTRSSGVSLGYHYSQVYEMGNHASSTFINVQAHALIMG